MAVNGILLNIKDINSTKQTTVTGNISAMPNYNADYEYIMEFKELPALIYFISDITFTFSGSLCHSSQFYQKSFECDSCIYVFLSGDVCTVGMSGISRPCHHRGSSRCRYYKFAVFCNTEENPCHRSREGKGRKGGTD